MLEDTNARGTILLQPGTLQERAIATTQHALKSGALVTIPTQYEFVEQQGVCFLVRIAANLNRKDEAQKQDRHTTTTGKDFNPFLPYDENLYVADISDTHVCLLNKFNVVDCHLLLITRAFEKQETLLTLADFEAMWTCLAEIDGLAFYNGGKTAGASQRHKHLQIVPLPLTPAEPQIPIETLLVTTNRGVIEILPNLPFVHAFVRLDAIDIKSPQIAIATLNYYRQMLDAVGLQNNTTLEHMQAGAYNLLVTQQWMLLIPRSQESFESIAINSLGFAGTMFVRDDRQMQILKEWGPMCVLSRVAITW